MGHGLSEGWGILGPYQLVHVKFGISSWRGSRVDSRSYLQSGAIDGSEANGIIRDSKSCKVRVGSNGNLLWEASVLYDEKKDDRGVTEGREDVREVFQQRGSGAKRKLSKCGRTQMGNEPILALLDGADDFVVYYDARSKDLEACLEKGRRRSEAKNEFEIDVRRSDLDVAWLGPTSVKRDGEWFILVGQGLASIWRDVKTSAIEEAYTTKYPIHPGADAT
ncbi:hypothetical protein Tco_0373953 [Tanacetum coccineum]